MRTDNLKIWLPNFGGVTVTVTWDNGFRKVTSDRDSELSQEQKRTIIREVDKYEIKNNLW